MMELMQQNRTPDIDEVIPEDEILRIILGANVQLGHVYRDISSVYGGLGQVDFTPNGDEEAKKLINEIQGDLKMVGSKVKAAINNLQAAFDVRVTDRDERMNRRDDGRPIGRYA